MARGRTSSICIALSAEARHTLAHWQRSTILAAGLVLRGKRLLSWAAGHSHSDVAPQVAGVQHTVVWTWAKRFLAQRLDGAHGGSWPAVPKGGFLPSGRAVAIPVVCLTCERPIRLGRRLSQWDCAELARQLVADGILAELSAATIRRICAAHQLKPWRHHLRL